MKLLIDADACPVVNIAVKLCSAYQVHCLLLCDTAHIIHKPGAETLVFDQGADSVDLALVNRVEPGDIVITQDYGLASMCLARTDYVLHQDGWRYTPDNIDALLFERHAAKKFRAAGSRTKGPGKRTAAQDRNFQAALEQLFQQIVHG